MTHIQAGHPLPLPMTECSELVDQIVNSVIVTMFLLGGWMLSVYGTAGPDVFDTEAEDASWAITINDSDGDNDVSDGDTVTVTGGSLGNDELERAAFLLMVKAAAGGMFVFSACMIGQRFGMKSKSD